ncbi:MAG: hypothetical protein U1F57_12230 [bacterium]
MKKCFVVFWVVFASFVFSPSVFAALDEEASGPKGSNLGGQEKTSGFFVGGDSGVLVPLGKSSDIFSLHFLSGAKGGYSFKRILNLQLRILEANGRLERNSSSTFFFMTDAEVKVNFLRKAFSPFIVGGVGFYFLDFGGSDPLVKRDTNLTYMGGGGFDYIFGSNSVGIAGGYRGFSNKGKNFKALEITIQYAFHFF